MGLLGYLRGTRLGGVEKAVELFAEKIARVGEQQHDEQETACQQRAHQRVGTGMIGQRVGHHAGIRGLGLEDRVGGGVGREPLLQRSRVFPYIGRHGGIAGIHPLPRQSQGVGLLAVADVLTGLEVGLHGAVLLPRRGAVGQLGQHLGGAFLPSACCRHLSGCRRGMVQGVGCARCHLWVSRSDRICGAVPPPCPASPR